MRIDAHQHFWEIRRGDYGWLTPASGPLWQDFQPADLAPLLAAGGVDRTILVQAAPTEDETCYLLNIAQKTSWVAGVVGWEDFAAPDAVARIAALAGDRLLVGLRPMVQDIADDDWLLRADLAPAFGSLVEHGLVFDALVLPRHLARLAPLAEQHPRLTVVIDHAAKPHIAAQNFAGWREDMQRLAALPNVFCKLSGLVTEAGEGWRVEHLAPVVEHLIATFGPRRLIFGSDWPVCTLRASYGAWLGTCEDLLSGLTGAERAAIFGGNAQRVYLQTRGR